ncbi:acyltransferase [uncultured Microbacterium sp.]|uniref:acyltransferase family protein n=1 Tax=uncultured Microbacterium sp. TaxID=191216 RepID=UPI0025D19015|nr:acyltransferase [uncultured Microbacterium sp.]
MSGATDLPRDLPSLTGLRYVAAALVVFHHAAPVFIPEAYLGRFAEIGYIGVMFFFTLSGFVLTWAIRPGGRTRDFYQSRFARIYPLYLATWAAAVAASFMLGDDKSWIGIILSLILLQAWVPDPQVYGAGNSPGWSLSVEAFFYALFPFLTGKRMRLQRRSRLLLPLLALFVGVGIVYSLTPVYSHWFAYYSPIYNLSAFIIGILLAGSIRAGARMRISTWQALTVGGVIYLALGVLWPECPRGFANAVMLAPAVLLIAAAATNDIQGRRSVWATKPLVRLGQWSFALYLVHYMMVRLIGRYLPNAITTDTPLGVLGTVVFLALATGVSAAVFYVIEMPAQRLLRPRVKRAGKEEVTALSSDPF